MGLFDFFSKPPSMPSYSPVQIRSNADLIDSEYLSQPFSRYQQLADDFNKAYQSGVYSAIPGLESSISRYGAITESFQKGELPADTLYGLQKDAAYAGLSGRGTSSGEMTQFDLLQNLGLERLNLQQQGQNYTGQMLDFGRALTPEGSGSQYRVDFGTLANRIDQETYYNNNINNQNKQIAFYNSQRKSPFENLVSNAIGSVISAPFNALSSVISAPFNAIGGAANMFAGGIAGGMAQQGLNALGMGGSTGLGSAGSGYGGGYGGAPQQMMSMPQLQNPTYQMLGAGPNMQAMNTVPTSVAVSNPTMIAGNQQKYLTTAPTGASTMPVFAGSQGVGIGGNYYEPNFSGYYGSNMGLGGSRKSQNMGNLFSDYGDFLGGMFGTGSRTNAGSVFGGQ
jgi:hypothetical protein